MIISGRHVLLSGLIIVSACSRHNAVSFFSADACGKGILATFALTGSRVIATSYLAPLLVFSKLNVTLEPASPTSRVANSFCSHAPGMDTDTAKHRHEHTKRCNAAYSAQY